MLRIPPFLSRFTSPPASCEKCGGNGKIVKARCPVCAGRKVVHGTDDITLEIEQGMQDGEELVFPRAGDQSGDMDVTPGDVVYQIRTVPHRRFERRGDDLYMSLAITLNEAINGFNKKFRHLDGTSYLTFLGWRRQSEPTRDLDSLLFLFAALCKCASQTVVCCEPMTVALGMLAGPPPPSPCSLLPSFRCRRSALWSVYVSWLIVVGS